MAQTNQVYIYTPLQHLDSIRLLELLPGVKGSPLSCNIAEVRRGNSPKYEALSYAWGEAEFLHTIEEVTSSTRLSITVNLHTALQAIRHEHASRVLWVDAICINQLDMNEKNHQVAFMGKIFGDAWRVVVWLGRHRGAPNRIISILKDLVHWKMLTDASWEYEPVCSKLMRIITRLFSVQFFEQPWFNRVWVIQELILARDVELLAGDDLIPLRLLQDATKILSKLREFLERRYMSIAATEKNVISIATRVFKMLSYREELFSRNLQSRSLRHEASGLSLASCVLQLGRGKQCKYARDRIYAMLAVANDDLGIVPDYDLPLPRVLTDFATRSLLNGDLAVLHASGIHPNRESNLDSFTPSLRDQSGMPSELSAAELNYAAASQSPVLIRTTTANTFSLRGARIDTTNRSTPCTKYHFRYNEDKLSLSIPTMSIYWIFKDQDLPADFPCYSGVLTPYTETFLGALVLRTLTLDTLLTSDYADIFSWIRESYEYKVIMRSTSIYSIHITSYLENRRWFRTTQGYLGLGPFWMKPGDQVVIFDGGTTPFILRKVVSEDGEPDGTWQLVGDCFLLGWMHGDYFGYTVVDEMPPSTEDGEQDAGGDGKKYLVKEFFTLV